ASLNALLGLALVAGGIWLVAVGGSWYYLIAGLTLFAVSGLLLRRRVEALWLYAMLLLATLAWSLWEVGLSWWPLAARANPLFFLGLFLLTPWVTRQLVHRKRSTQEAREQYAPAVRRAAMPLVLALVLFAGVGVSTWFVAPPQQ